MEKKHRCSICDKQFSSLRSLRNHAGSEYPNTVQPQRCGCGKSFCSKNALKMHQSARGSTCVFKCSGCAKKFNSESALKNHLASPAHSRPPPQTNAPSPTSSPNATTGDQGSVGYISVSLRNSNALVPVLIWDSASDCIRKLRYQLRGWWTYHPRIECSNNTCSWRVYWTGSTA